TEAPSFTAWDLDRYTSSLLQAAAAAPGQGLTVVRAAVRQVGALDYVLIGFDKRLHGIRIIAILSDSAHRYRVASVSDGPDRADSLAKVPDRYLTFETSPKTGTSDLVVLPMIADPSMRGLGRYAWDATRSGFFLVSPND